MVENAFPAPFTTETLPVLSIANLVPDEKYVVVIIPAYNEARSIGSVVIKARGHAHHVIVVDDGSHDDTSEIAAQAGAIVVRHKANSGKGVALNTGFRKAKELFLPAAVVTIDADWQHMPEEITKVAEPILRGEADLVIGSRYLEKTSTVPVQRIVGHWGFNMLLNLTSGTPLTDSQSGFRAFAPEVLDAMYFGQSGFSVESEMQFIARDHSLRVAEVPITIRYLDKPKRSVVSHGLRVLNGILRLVGQTRPLLFFSVPGILLILGGVIDGLLVIEAYNRHNELAIGAALIGVSLVFIGMLILCTGVILHSIRGLLLEFVRNRKADS